MDHLQTLVEYEGASISSLRCGHHASGFWDSVSISQLESQLYRLPPQVGANFVWHGESALSATLAAGVFNQHRADSLLALGSSVNLALGQNRRAICSCATAEASRWMVGHGASPHFGLENAGVVVPFLCWMLTHLPEPVCAVFREAFGPDLPTPEPVLSGPSVAPVSSAS